MAEGRFGKGNNRFDKNNHLMNDMFLSHPVKSCGELKIARTDENIMKFMDKFA